MARERLAAAALAVALAATLAPAPSAHADPVKVAILHGSAPERLAPRIRAELTALGLEVVDVTTRGGDPPDDAELDAAARLAGAAAAIRIAAPGTAVWIAGGEGKPYVVRVVSADLPPSSSPDAVIVLRAVELVRAALLDPPAPSPASPAAADPPPPAAPPLPPAEPIASAPPPPRARFELELAPVIAGAPGGVPATASLLLGARWMDRHLGPAAFVVLPIFSAHLDGHEGTAGVRAALAGAGIHFVPGPAEASLRPSVEAGMSGVWLLVHGTGSAGYAGRGDNLLFAAPYLRAGLSLAISPRVALGASCLGAVALAEPVISFAGRTAASFGRPLLLGSGGLEITLP